MGIWTKHPKKPIYKMPEGRVPNKKTESWEEGESGGVGGKREKGEGREPQKYTKCQKRPARGSGEVFPESESTTVINLMLHATQKAAIEMEMAKRHLKSNEYISLWE